MPDETQKTSRRSFLQRLTLLGTAGAITPLVLSACGGGGSEGGTEMGADTMGAATGEPEADNMSQASVDCTDTSGLTEQQLQMRTNSQYVDQSPNTDKYCGNCQLFKQPEAGQQCGGCQVIAGPINPQGYCNLWVAKSA